MGHRLSKIVTRTGDDGTTGLSDGSRVRKDDALIEAIGTVDELNSVIGFAESQQTLPHLREALVSIQHDLFDLGGALSLPGHPLLTEAHVEALEQTVGAWNADLTPLKEFILPGGSPAVAAMHMARTVCRRAERRLLSLDDERTANGRVYLNRLSDLLFVGARLASEGQERSWKPQRFS
ncbi:cob(I)yrinic acid a,c-diamide adenosyltransferase [Devosia sp.]|uniref:cob(I)yrinic acid a,c-diamide adenosyltransferase n=1 Tax=Devosia sp. TaxID=1871048 RepID=UPI001B2CC543|nr:cob(I)yrinic acid a,c-diamide adenosyltransferase [Devosia sp.]MBO9591008.1 cob(I)yrinic acid a,c-diamide adenosyltransferase [Devosia sp.]